VFAHVLHVDPFEVILFDRVRQQCLPRVMPRAGRTVSSLRRDHMLFHIQTWFNGRNCEEISDLVIIELHE
jgi:hypothetical protein